MPDLAALVKARGRVKGKITTFANFLEKARVDAEKRLEIPDRLKKLESTFSEFESLQREIETIAETEDHLREREDFEDSYFANLTKAKALLPALQNTALVETPPSTPRTTNVEVASNNLISGQTSIKLPNITLPKFAGQYEQWMSFRDLFTSLIHENAALTSVQKLHYLKASLIDEASQILKSLDLTHDNYDIAWKLLEGRYENKRLIVQRHLQSLMDIPAMTRESHLALRQLADDVKLHVNNLSKLGQPVETWDTILIYIFLSKMDKTSRREWELKRASTDEFPTLNDFTNFLLHRSAFLEALSQSNVSQFAASSDAYRSDSKPKRHTKQVSHAYVSSESNKCPVCQNNHKIYDCSAFHSLPPHDRLHEVRTKRLCIKCLKPYHGRDCKFSHCKKCKGYHNTLLHLNKPSTATTETNNNSTSTHVETKGSTSEVTNLARPNNNDMGITSYNHCAIAEPSRILLSTAIVLIKDRLGNLHECRALLDSGSQSNFMTTKLYEKLHLPAIKRNTTVVSINSTSLNTTQQVITEIHSKFNAYKAKLPFILLDKITDSLPVSKVPTKNLIIPANVTLADPTYHTPGEIDLLIGATIFWDLLCVGQFKLSKRAPTLQKTQFGWIITGAVPIEPANQDKQISHCHFVSKIDVQNQLERFWTLEELPSRPHYSKEELQCEEMFKHTHARDHEGRFVVSLPLKGTLKLGDSRATAEKRFFVLERKLERQPELKEQYHAFLKEYLDLRHMTKISTESQITNEQYFLPHHAVLKDSTTTKLRVVFDASCPSSNGNSLNDLLMTGPTIQQDLFNILIRFRQHKYVMTADITKMYRQINLCQSQWNLQQILWRWNQDEPLQIYALKTVTYGMSSSPFLAIRCLHEIAQLNKNELPEASSTILSDFYVDDLLTGHNNLTHLTKLKKDITNILAEAKLPLRKWRSNATELNEMSLSENPTVQLGESTKTLGLWWTPREDTLHYNMSVTTDLSRTTKRTILSNVSQIYDPLGLLGPCIIQIKVLLQQLWQLNLGWDESVPLSIHTLWEKWKRQAHHLNHLNIPRCVITENPAKIEIHGFSDASELAYGACVYLRSANINNTYTVHLLCAKSRVAPLKQLSIPRLELCGALLLANLCRKVVNSLTVAIDNIYYWSDSTITLAWISGEPSQWTTFVANRIAEIQHLTKKENWHYVQSERNPADGLSRGIHPQDLQANKIWWHGPEFLYENLKFQTPTIKHDKHDIPESRRKNVTLICMNKATLDPALIPRFSSLNRLVHTIAYCLRFKFNCQNKMSRIIGPVTVPEITVALNLLTKSVQAEEFGPEIRCLRNKTILSHSSKLLNLHPFLDDSGLLRVGGRLHNAPLHYSQKHPIVLPSKHHFTDLIIRDEHYKHLHAGPQALLATIRSRYWPLLGKQAIRRVLRKCIICFRTRPSTCEQLMGNLPTSRVTPTRPFLNTGLDYAGPFTIKISRNKNTKAYLCVFVCFSTKAIHLELVSDLSTQAFLNSLKRFFARRGKSQTLYSDNGTNFVGANNQLRELKNVLTSTSTQREMLNYLTDQFVNWRFVPPYSPHMGGLWESAVKSAKTHLRKIVGSTPLTFEELYTVMAQIEACLNSRPITAISDDPTDLSALTPGHFIIGEPLTAIPEIDLTDTPNNRLNRYQLLMQMRQHFWMRWSKEYITQLQQRYKWNRNVIEFKIGALVLIKNETTMPLNWPLGRITELHPGQDGVVRIVTLRTKNGLIQRAVNKLCMLPISDNILD